MTPEERIETFAVAYNAFVEHLHTVAGVRFSQDIRFEIVKCAHHALNCNECSEKRDSLVTEYKEWPGFTSISRKAASTLTDIIHAIIWHQDLLNKTWYLDTMNKMKACNLVQAIADEDPGLSYHAAFCEILVLSSVSHGFHILYLSLDLDHPPLPSTQDLKKVLPPSQIKFKSLLNKVHNNDKFGHSPYFLWRDVNRSSSAYKKLSPSVRNLFPKYFSKPFGPFTCVGFALDDTVFLLNTFVSAFYMGKDELTMFWKPLDVSRKCPHVSRYQIEYVAAVIASTHKCSF
mmetsp:Transcript_1975/g.2464  ORF Transcript_1975/g.2464 Transcript_1975/m.2464 type:complete len:288 (-) Transcript_1975:524-1387(-)